MLAKTNGKGQSEVARKFGMHRQQVNVIWKKGNGQEEN